MSGGLWGFVGRLAWRDSRASRRRLALFTSCIAVGVAALVAVGSLGRALEAGIARQARSLLGADLSIGSRVPFNPDAEAFMRSLGGEQAREIAFSTMIDFPATRGARLVQVRALEGGFPFYGRLETEPEDADARFRREGGVLVEESLLIQFGARVGDEVRIGGWSTRVAGILRRVPGETVAFSTLAPRVYLRMSDLPATGLLQSGSLARYRVLFRMPEGTDVTALVRRHQARFDALRLAHATVEERQEDLGQAMRNLYQFLHLAGFIALLLGGVGVATAIHAHVKQKVPTVAILRCLGCSIRMAFAVYLLQAAAAGALAVGAGALLGLAIHWQLPVVIGDFVPFQVETRPSWKAVAEGSALGFGICVAFALLPLSAVRRVSPLGVLRSAYEPERRRRDPLTWGIVAVLALLVLGFALAHTRRWQEGLGFAGGLLVAGCLLAGVGRAGIALARRLRFPCAPFAVRQGLANLHRPHNRTLLLVVALGLGTFLLHTLDLSRRALVGQFASERDAGRANAILFDIQPDQREAVARRVREEGLPVLDEAPIVTMRLKSLRGRPIEALLAEQHDAGPRPAARRGGDGSTPGWLLRREFRSTFSDRLRDSERIVAGTWIPRGEPGAEPVPISVEDGVAEELHVGLGDEIEWDVQGVPLKTRVASLRKVDWRRVQPNFFVVFPRGPLDDAPAFHVLVTRVQATEQSARLQRRIVEEFPNVSVIDITVVLRTLDQILGKIALAIRFMASFTVATGGLMLLATVLSGRWQRVRESVLFRVLGASRRQVLLVLVVEYAALGLLGSLTGVGLSWLGAWCLSAWVFELPFVAPWPAAVATTALATLLTVVAGLLASRGVTTHPPLEILRNDERQ